MAPTLAYLRTIVPEVAGLSDDVLGIFVVDAALEVDRETWGARADRATALLAGHMATMAHPEMAATVGAVTSEHAGGVSTSYGAPGLSASDALGATRPGQEYLRMREMLCLGFAVS